jgi:broad specificity phosphatase PhoE
MKILLVRHGRSAHVHRGFIDVAGFHRWREAYEAAGIDEQDQPPAALKALAATSSIIVASTAPRAVHSAMLLGRDVTPSPLLAELALAPPNIRGIRMPLIGWALSIGIRRHVSPVEVQRARDAAQWLRDLAAEHGTVLAVTHASFRSLLSRELIARGWHCEIPKGRSRHWSVWSLKCTDASARCTAE